MTQRNNQTPKLTRDERPICVGYLRQCPTCQDESHQRERLGWWYCAHAREYEWGGWYRDKPKAENELRRTGRKQRRYSYMSVRPGCEQMLEMLRPGDMLLTCRLGVLCNDITDALENLPGYLGRDIRVALTEDHVELSRGYLGLLRALQRDWLLSPRKSISHTPPMGIRKDGHKWAPAVKELDYLRWCYRHLVLSPDELRTDVLEKAKKTLIHPRTGRPPRDLSALQRAANAYHDALVLVKMGKELPRWLILAKKKGFFNEDFSQIAAARAAGLDPFPEDDPVVPHPQPHPGPQATATNGR